MAGSIQTALGPTPKRATHVGVSDMDVTKAIQRLVWLVRLAQGIPDNVMEPLSVTPREMKSHARCGSMSYVRLSKGARQENLIVSCSFGCGNQREISFRPWKCKGPCLLVCSQPSSKSFLG